MAKQTINIGTTANDGTGDAIRAAFGKVNDNFTEIYTANTGTNTGDQNLSAYATTAAVAAGYQPLDSDLTAISALTTTAYGRALLSTADAATLRSAIGVGTTDAPTFLAQTLTGQSLTGTQATSLVDLSATWNTTGNPSLIYGRVTNTNSGASANLIDLGTFAGGSLFSVSKAGAVTAQSLNITQTASANIFSTSAAALQTSGYLGVARAINLIDTAGISWSSTSTLLGATGINLLQDAAGILAQRNARAAQMLRVYGDFIDVNNYERASFGYSGGQISVGSDAAGTGVHRKLSILGAGIDFYHAGIGIRWSINTSGHFTAATDNAYDIGASGANRPKDIYVAGNATIGVVSILGGFGGIIRAGDSGFFTFGSSRSTINSPADSIMRLANAAGNDFNRLQLGGTTSAYPAIKRNGAGIDIRLADDTGFASLMAGSISASVGSSLNSFGDIFALAGRSLGWNAGAARMRSLAADTGGVITLFNSAETGFTRLEFGATNLGISRGTGSPEGVVTALVGSLYIRTDGGASTTLYVKESSPTPSTGWVAK